jgi:hypothetical protein
LHNISALKEERERIKRILTTLGIIKRLLNKEQVKQSAKSAAAPFCT